MNPVIPLLEFPILLDGVQTTARYLIGDIKGWAPLPEGDRCVIFTGAGTNFLCTVSAEKFEEAYARMVGELQSRRNQAALAGGIAPPPGFRPVR